MILTIILHRGMIKILNMSINMLDSKIAQAIKSVIEGDLPIAEPISPIQQMLMSVIQQNLSKTAPDISILRDENGKFTK